MLCLCALLFSRVPDPIIGPKGVRMLLVWQGVFGFRGRFGIFYSLKYLALSEVIVLIFLAPFTTAILGVVTLGGEYWCWTRACWVIEHGWRFVHRATSISLWFCNRGRKACT
ncbi:hypothetical protein DFS33DRAFT_1360221 [Desarmillaria ectypa]|nr:hypothetical protein DFS33DRAFT_1360221 [Desarmillaria ectypa]